MNIDNESRSIMTFRAVDEGKAPPPNPGDDTQFHQARERAERRAAKQATCVEARRIHQELAQAHARLSRPGWPRGH